MIEDFELPEGKDSRSKYFDDHAKEERRKHQQAFKKPRQPKPRFEDDPFEDWDRYDDA